MRRYILLLLVPLLSAVSCAGYQQAVQRQQQQRRNDLRWKAEVLQSGSSIESVKSRWGEPDDSTFTQQGATSIQRLQYGKCIARRGMTRGVLFVTFVDGKVLRYSVIEC